MTTARDLIVDALDIKSFLMCESEQERGARALDRFNVQKQGARKIPSPLELCMLKRRERRAPLAPSGGRSILRFSLTPGFSPMTGDGERLNRFNGFPRAGKPLKRLEFTSCVSHRAEARC